MWGYFIEINSKDYDKIDKTIFIQRQSLANATRFITDELTDFQNKLFQAVKKINEIELEILANIQTNILDNFDILQEISKTISYLDVICSFAKSSNFV